MLSSSVRLRFMVTESVVQPTLVTVVYSSAPRQSHEWFLQLAAGQTVAQALASSVFVRFPELQAASPDIGIWGKKTRLGHVLQAGDRLEVYRPLRVDPKVARRERFDRQGAKTAGLFAARRAGAKAGY
jgi:putative ubiquitin-RnfH superfamily antitoxin RatB of RatAB toxin-antitoxin module